MDKLTKGFLGTIATGVLAYLLFRKLSKKKEVVSTKAAVNPAIAAVSNTELNFLNLTAGTGGGCPPGQTYKISYYKNDKGEWVKKVECAPIEVDD